MPPILKNRLHRIPFLRPQRARIAQPVHTDTHSPSRVAAWVEAQHAATPTTRSAMTRSPSPGGNVRRRLTQSRTQKQTRVFYSSNTDNNHPSIPNNTTTTILLALLLLSILLTLTHPSPTFHLVQFILFLVSRARFSRSVAICLGVAQTTGLCGRAWLALLHLLVVWLVLVY